MANLQTIEIPTRVGCLDDSAFETDGAADAHGVRELVRTRNLLVCRPKMVFRYLAAAQGSDTDATAYGAALSWGSPFWTPALPLPVDGIEVAKTPGMTLLRLAVRAVISTDREVDFALGTRGKPFRPDLALTEYLKAFGTGASERFTKDDIEAHPADGESLDLWQRAALDPDNDPALSTGTYGGTSSGTVTAIMANGAGQATFFSAGAAWNVVGSQVHKGGHAVTFRTAGDSRIVYGPCPITEVWRGAAPGTGLTFQLAPGTPTPRVQVGDTYKITTLPAVRVLSVAVYEAARTR